MQIEQRAELILEMLKQDYPQLQSPMFHRNAFEMLIAVMLSPQTNDEITNQVTPRLFDTYSTPAALAAADPAQVLEIIRPINYNKTKSERIVKAAELLVQNFDSLVPATLAELTTLPGVGRKVANVIINDWYAVTEDQNIPYAGDPSPNRYNSIERGSVSPAGFVVDTHVERVAQALKLTESKTAARIEQDLMQVFPADEWMGASLRMIFHGRQVFQAKNPQFNNFPNWQEIYQSLGY